MTISSSHLPKSSGGLSFRRRHPCILLLVLFVLPGLTGGCESPESASEPLGPPDALIERWVGMWNSYDLNEVEELFLEDPRITYLSSEREGVIQGMEELLDHHRGFGFVPGGDARASRLWLDGLRTDLFGDVAVVTGVWYFASDEASGEEPQRGPVTFVTLWSSGRWSFVHMNFSEYLSPDSI